MSLPRLVLDCVVHVGYDSGMKKKAKPQLTHGGARPGSGRTTKLGRKAPLSVRLTPDVIAFLDSILDPELVAQSDDAPSRSDFIDSAVRKTSEFKKWVSSNQ